MKWEYKGGAEVEVHESRDAHGYIRLESKVGRMAITTSHTRRNHPTCYHTAGVDTETGRQCYSSHAVTDRIARANHEAVIGHCLLGLENETIDSKGKG